MKSHARPRAHGRMSAAALAVLALVALAFASPASSGSAARARIGSGQLRDSLVVKFVEGSAVRIAGGRFASRSGADLSGTNAVLDRYDAEPSRLISRRDVVNRNAARARKRGRQVADLNLAYVLALSSDDAERALNDLLGEPVVETAYGAPKPAPAPALTPDFTGSQDYRDAAPNGIDVASVLDLPGGTGSHVTIADIEYSWNTKHEDLSDARVPGAVLRNGVDPFGDRNHGTAVLGELVGDDNGSGVTGITHASPIRLVHAQTNEGYSIAEAISVATSALASGDVILIEQQTGTQDEFCLNVIDGSSCVPVEYWPMEYAAIQAAIALGITVVEAAGNGGDDLDTVMYDNSAVFNGGRADSGAIIVGAGNAPGCTTPQRGRRDFSTFGSRVNLQGWGECVTTTGYGDLQFLTKNRSYTQFFSGTSSASPIVAGAAALVSSTAQADGTPLTPAQIRTLLVTTGTAQEFGGGALAGDIGPMPDLAAAITGTGPGLEVSILDSKLKEGDRGQRFMSFELVFSGPRPPGVELSLTTTNGSAKAGKDYVDSDLTAVPIDTGSAPVLFEVPIKGDTLPERNERFIVTITEEVGVVVADGQAVGTIKDDD